jgi:hypothetical protein
MYHGADHVQYELFKTIEEEPYKDSNARTFEVSVKGGDVLYVIYYPR